MLLTPALTGFATAFALILAIGAQNAFVLRQGLARAHVFWLCLLCAASDAVLIVAGVLGFGVIVDRFPMLPQIMAWGVQRSCLSTGQCGSRRHIKAITRCNLRGNPQGSGQHWRPGRRSPG